MGHQKRAAFIAELESQIPGALVVLDEKSDRWDTGRRSMLAHDPLADWHVVIQDDAVLCHDFDRQMRAALACAPGGPVAFYLSRTARNRLLTRRALRRERARGNCWIRWAGPWWGVGVAVKPVDIGPMIEWCDCRSDIPNYDRRMARYFEDIGRACWYSIPSLVDHRTGIENPSLIEGRASAGRYAMCADPPRGPWTSSCAVLPITDPTPSSQRHTLGLDGSA